MQERWLLCEIAHCLQSCAWGRQAFRLLDVFHTVNEYFRLGSAKKNAAAMYLDMFVCWQIPLRH